MYRRILPVLAVTLLLPGQAFAVNANDTKVPNDDSKIVCAGQSDVATGSNIRSKRICLTKREWREIEAQTQRDFQKLNDKYTAPGRAEGR